jgi:hypothetical protein
MLIKDLQRAAVDVVGAAQPVGCGPTLEQDESDAPARQLGGEHQAGRTSAEDCHVEFRHFGTVPAKCGHRPILTIAEWRSNRVGAQRYRSPVITGTRTLTRLLAALRYSKSTLLIVRRLSADIGTSIGCTSGGRLA